MMRNGSTLLLQRIFRRSNKNDGPPSQGGSRGNSRGRHICTYDRAGCQRVDAKKKYETKPYVCPCGYEHFSVRDSSNWAGNGWEWEYKR